MDRLCISLLGKMSHGVYGVSVVVLVGIFILVILAGGSCVWVGSVVNEIMNVL